MIDFNYVLTVDMKTSAPEYKPDPNMPTHLRNIFKISGPNSSGKSTFMNIVALAAHGLKNPAISDSIKVRMKDLIEADYKTLEFKLRMEDPISKTVLRAEKNRDSNDITLFESINGGREKVLSPDSFLNNYKLIYDIPENPIGRIKELTLELVEWQKGYSSSFSDFQKYVDEVYKDVKDSRDERAITGKKSDLAAAKRDLENLRKKDNGTEIESLKKLILAEKLYKAKKDKDAAETDYNKMKPHLKPLLGNVSDNSAKNAFSSEFRDIRGYVENIITNSAFVKDRGLNEVLNRLEPINSANKISEENDFERYVSDLNELIKNALRIEEPQVDNEARMINDLLVVLNKYKGEVNYLSGLGPLNELIASLEKTATNKGDNSAKRKAISNIKVDAKNIMNAQTPLKTAFSKLNAPHNNNDDNLYRNALTFETKYKDAKNKLDSLLSESKQYGMNLDNVVQIKQFINGELGGKYSLKKIEDLEKILNTLIGNSVDAKEIDGLNNYIGATQAELNKMESAKIHEYRGKEPIIKRISNEIQYLRGNYRVAQEKIGAVQNNQYGKFDPKDPFFESVWVYFGSRLGYVQHLQVSYEVEKVNFIEDLIITKDGTHIHMKDMGTGQGQVTYLLGLLSSDDNKKIIAMFDEVAAMSPSTLSKIFGRFEELQKDGRLMLGMTVLPGDDFEVTQYGLDG